MADSRNLVLQLLITAKDEASAALGKLGDKITGLAKTALAFVGVGVSMQDGVQSAADFEEQLGKVAVKGGYTAAQMAELQAGVERVAAQFGVTGTEAAQGMEVLAAAGLSAQDALATLPQVLALAALEGLSLDDAATKLSDTLSIMGLGFDQAGRMADVLAKGANITTSSAASLSEALSRAGGQAKAAGLDLEQTVAALDLLHKNGIKGSEAGTSLAAILTQLLNPASAASAELNALRISSRDLGTVLDGLQAAGAKAGPAILAFGDTAGPGLRALIGEGQRGLNDFTDQLRNLDGDALKASQALSNNFNSALKTLGAAWDRPGRGPVAARAAPGSVDPAKPVPAPPRASKIRLDVWKDLGGALDPETIAAAAEASAAADARAQAIARAHTAPARAPLGPRNPLDWDEEPTFYQATTIAHGHLVHFRQVWIADGFSLGDLLYSLPLAPAQKKQIAVIDWERRESAERREELLATERLAAELNRDRDIMEIVDGTVAETMKGASLAVTGGVAKSKGGSGKGRVMGVAGGGGGAASGAIQDSGRTLAVAALQQLHDRTAQAAAALRSQRATVVQAVTQGETARVETETVTNYNHCHAMTMEYFEVLRHFRVEHEMAGVDECLFVPLPMSTFTEAKALRWRTALQPQVLERRLLPGFDAIDRRRHHYEGSDLPERRHADEEVESMEGELAMEFSWVRPRDDDKGEFAEAAWSALKPLLVLKGGPAALFARYLAGRVQAERDRLFRDHIVPVAIEGFVQALRVRVGGRLAVGPQFQDAEMDASLISRPRAGVPLRISLRPKGAAPRLTRAQITVVTLDVENYAGDAEARALVRTASIRYRTTHREDFLFRERRVDNDLAADDAVRIDAPLSREELRNPREEDKEFSRRLLAHLNENLEYYHRSIWLGMDAARRFMLLDGIEAPGTSGRSVAAVVENRVVAVVGNSLVMPVAPGFRLDPNHRGGPPLLQLYAPLTPFPAVRFSLPTRGVFAEAVMGECNSCEKIDDTRFWRWEESPIPGEPPAIAPVSADSRATAAPDLTAKDFATPIISLQNAPPAPDPSGLGAALGVLGASSLFRDVTGLEGNQKNAAAALAGAFGASSAASDAAVKAVERAADLQLQKQLARDGDRILDKIESAHASGAIDDDQRRQATGDFLRGISGGGSFKDPVSVQEFQEIMAASGESGVAASFDPTTGALNVNPVQVPTAAKGILNNILPGPPPYPAKLQLAFAKAGGACNFGGAADSTAVVLDSSTGALVEVSLETKTLSSVPLYKPGPDLGLTGFVGPTYALERNELVIGARETSSGDPVLLVFQPGIFGAAAERVVKPKIFQGMGNTEVVVRAVCEVGGNLVAVALSPPSPPFQTFPRTPARLEVIDLATGEVAVLGNGQVAVNLDLSQGDPGTFAPTGDPVALAHEHDYLFLGMKEGQVFTLNLSLQPLVSAQRLLRFEGADKPRQIKGLACNGPGAHRFTAPNGPKESPFTNLSVLTPGGEVHDFIVIRNRMGDLNIGSGILHFFAVTPTPGPASAIQAFVGLMPGAATGVAAIFGTTLDDSGQQRVFRQVIITVTDPRHSGNDGIYFV